MVRIAGITYPLTYNGAATFALWERYGRHATQLLQESTPSGAVCLRGAALIMAEQGELLRRYQGYEPAGIMPDSAVEGITSISGVLQLRAAILEQIVTDIRQNVEAEQKDVDLGLLELQEKNGGGMTVSHYLRMGTVAGLSAKETMLLPVGQVFDLWELYLKANTPSDGED